MPEVVIDPINIMLYSLNNFLKLFNACFCKLFSSDFIYCLRNFLGDVEFIKDNFSVSICSNASDKWIPHIHNDLFNVPAFLHAKPLKELIHGSLFPGFSNQNNFVKVNVSHNSEILMTQKIIVLE